MLKIEPRRLAQTTLLLITALALLPAGLGATTITASATVELISAPNNARVVNFSIMTIFNISSGHRGHNWLNTAELHKNGSLVDEDENDGTIPQSGNSVADVATARSVTALDQCELQGLWGGNSLASLSGGGSCSPQGCEASNYAELLHYCAC